MQERLQKILSGAGVCSRRSAEKLIQSGAVTVNGITAQLGDRADADCDEICIHGRQIGGHETLHTIMLYKPVGVVTTMSDERGRKTVAELVKTFPVRLLPIGRLDQYSEGLLLMSNDGALIDVLTHPKYHVDKTYEVTVRGAQRQLSLLSQPMELDGYTIRPARVEWISSAGDTHVLQLTIHEGRNRQIRKMCSKAGLQVLRLRRIAVGSLPLDRTLKAGQWRELTAQELMALRQEVGEKS